MRCACRLSLASLPIVFVILLALCYSSADAGNAAYTEYPAQPPDYGHSVGGLSVSPSTACRSGGIAITGTGAPAGAQIGITMFNGPWQPGLVGATGTPLGQAVADGDGDWRLSTVVPELSNEGMPDYKAITRNGPKTIYAYWAGGAYTLKQTAFSVQDDCPGGAIDPLPETGLPLWLLAAGFGGPVTLLLVAWKAPALVARLRPRR